MLQEHNVFSVTFKKYLWSAVLAAAIAPALALVGNAAWADDFNWGRKGNEAGDDRGSRLIKVIPVPVSTDNTTAGGLYSWDIGWVDQATETYYVADRSNKSVDIVDTANPGTVTQLKASPSFAGISPGSPVTFPTGTSGPDGVVTGGHCLFVTDAPSRVVSFDFLLNKSATSTRRLRQPIVRMNWRSTRRTSCSWSSTMPIHRRSAPSSR
jgi:hypothetical protein